MITLSIFAKCAGTTGNLCHRILPRRLRSTSRLSTPVYSSSDSPSGSRHMPNKSRLYAQNLKGFCLPFPTLKPFFGHTSGCLTFLVFKDRHGKTVVHIIGCPFASSQSPSACACPKRLAFKTVDSYIGKIRAIFNELGRSRDWNTMLGFGNPGASFEVRSYLKTYPRNSYELTSFPTFWRTVDICDLCLSTANGLGKCWKRGRCCARQEKGVKHEPEIVNRYGAFWP